MSCQISDSTLSLVVSSPPLKSECSLALHKLVRTCTENVAVSEKWLNVGRLNIQGDVSRLDCKLCGCFVAILENGKVINIDERLEEVIDNTWKKVRTEREKICYYILSQIVYPEFDTPRAEKYESPYDYADEFDEIILRWQNGRPVGFYTIKLKGTEIYATSDAYSMPTIDTAYVRSQYRNQGIGLEILSDVIARFPDDDIGFAKPISNGMFGVLKRFLTERKDYRLRFWELQDGDEGTQKLIWFVLRNHKQRS